MVSMTGNRITWLEKRWSFKHGYGWYCHVYGLRPKIGFGFSKNKFTAFRLALKEYTNRNSQ